MVKATSVLPSWCKVFQKGQSTDSLLKKLKVRRTRSKRRSTKTGTAYWREHSILFSFFHQDLQSNLSALNDKPNDTTLDTLRDQLIKEDLLFHKDKEVRSSLACCLADLLRICAPDPPFDEGQLQVRESAYGSKNLRECQANPSARPSFNSFWLCLPSQAEV